MFDGNHTKQTPIYGDDPNSNSRHCLWPENYWPVAVKPNMSQVQQNKSLI